MKLGYWDCRANGQVARLLIAYLGIPCQHITYKLAVDQMKWFTQDKK